jgi:addiction module HigA family antidote
MHNPPHPGLVLREYLGDMAVSTAAKRLWVTRVTLSRVLNGKAGISASMALRLGRLWAPRRIFGSTCRPSTTSGGPGVADNLRCAGSRM